MEKPRPNTPDIEAVSHEPDSEGNGIEERKVTLLPEPDEPDPGHIDPADDYREGVDLDADAED